MSANHEQSHAADHGHEGGLNTKNDLESFLDTACSNDLRSSNFIHFNF
jgi:hypothetical protein